MDEGGEAAAEVDEEETVAAEVDEEQEPDDEPDEPDEPDDEPADEPDGEVDESDDELDESDDELDDEAEEAPDQEAEPPKEKSPPKKLGARAVARAAVEQVVEMTGKSPEGVTSVSRSDEGWLVGVEVVETERIPDSADVLAIYEADLDEDAELMSYRRVRRYPRGRGDE